MSFTRRSGKLTKERRLTDKTRFELTNPTWNGAAEERQQRGPAIERVAGAFSSGDQMYDGGATPLVPDDWRRVGPEKPAGAAGAAPIDAAAAPNEDAAKEMEKPPLPAEPAKQELSPERKEQLRILTYGLPNER